MMIRTSSIAAIVLLTTIVACANGADPSPTIIQQPANDPPKSGFQPEEPSGTGSTPTGDQSIESLFEPPASDKATPDSLNGLWAKSNSDSIEIRIKFAPKSLTFAKKCTKDSKISHVTVRTRENADGGITILETKENKVESSSCSLNAVQVSLAEWKMCASSYDNVCLRLDGTSLSGVDNVTGESVSASYQLDKWIKLSD
jgi:hypothetical protein